MGESAAPVWPGLPHNRGVTKKLNWRPVKALGFCYFKPKFKGITGLWILWGQNLPIFSPILTTDPKTREWPAKDCHLPRKYALRRHTGISTGNVVDHSLTKCPANRNVLGYQILARWVFVVDVTRWVET